MKITLKINFFSLPGNILSMQIVEQENLTKEILPKNEHVFIFATPGLSVDDKKIFLRGSIKSSDYCLSNIEFIFKKNLDAFVKQTIKNITSIFEQIRKDFPLIENESYDFIHYDNDDYVFEKNKLIKILPEEFKKRYVFKTTRKMNICGSDENYTIVDRDSIVNKKLTHDVTKYKLPNNAGELISCSWEI